MADKTICPDCGVWVDTDTGGNPWNHMCRPTTATQAAVMRNKGRDEFQRSLEALSRLGLRLGLTEQEVAADMERAAHNLRKLEAFEREREMMVAKLRGKKADG